MLHNRFQMSLGLVVLITLMSVSWLSGTTVDAAEGVPVVAAPQDAMTIGHTQSATQTEMLKMLWTHYSNGNYVEAVETNGDTLWAATTGGVIAWDLTTDTPTKYTTLDGLPHNEANAVIVCPIPEPTLVVGTKEGAATYDPEMDIFVPMEHPFESIFNETVNSLACAPNINTLLIGNASSRGIYLYDGTDWSALNRDTGLEDYNFGTALGVVGDLEEIWVVDSFEVIRIVGDEVTLYDDETVELLDDSMYHIAVTNDGSVWFSPFIGDFLVQFKDEEWIGYELEIGFGGPSGGVSTPDGETLWVGSGFGDVCLFDPETGECVEIYEDEPGMLGFGTNDLEADAEGRVFYGNSFGEGISIFDGTGWRELIVPELIVENSVQGLGVDNDGMLWVGTRASGVQVLDPADPTAEWIDYASDITNLSVNVIVPDEAGGVWVGHGSGADYFDGATWTPFTRDEGNIPGVESIVIDSQDRVWMADINEGIAVWADGEVITMTEETDPALPTDSVRALLATEDAVYAATWGQGLLVFSNPDDVTEFEVFNEDNSDIPTDSTSALAVWDGEVIVGMDNYVTSFADGSFEVLADRDTDFEGLVTTIVPVEDQGLVLTTLFDGVYLWDDTGAVQLDMDDGLTTNQFYENSAVYLEDGTLWFGGLDGGMARLDLFAILSE